MREFFKKSGEPESQGKIAEFEHQTFLEAKRNELPKPPDLERILNKIKFELLEQAVHKLIAPTGIKKQDAKIIPPERLIVLQRLKDNPQALMSRNPGANCIEIYWDNLLECKRKNGYDKLSLLFLHTLIHEEVHGIGRQKLIGIIGENSDSHSKEKPEHYDGYTQGTLSMGVFENPKYKFWAFNEGITEMISLILFKAYLKKDSDFENHSDIAEFFRQLKRNFQEGNHYGVHMEVVEHLINILTNRCGLPSQVIRQAIIRGYFNENNLLDPEIADEIQNSLGDKVFINLQNASTKEDMKELLKELNIIDLIDNIGTITKDTKIPDQFYQPMGNINNKQNQQEVVWKTYLEKARDIVLQLVRKDYDKAYDYFNAIPVVFLIKDNNFASYLEESLSNGKFDHVLGLDNTSSLEELRDRLKRLNGNHFEYIHNLFNHARLTYAQDILKPLLINSESVNEAELKKIETYSSEMTEYLERVFRYEKLVEQIKNHTFVMRQNSSKEIEDELKRIALKIIPHFIRPFLAHFDPSSDIEKAVFSLKLDIEEIKNQQGMYIDNLEKKYVILLSEALLAKLTELNKYKLS